MKRVPTILGVVGAVAGAIVGLVITLANPPKGIGSNMVMTMFMNVAGIGFGGAIAGGVVGLILKAAAGKERTVCPGCGSKNAIAAHKSIWNGKPVPNRCPACGKEW